MWPGKQRETESKYGPLERSLQDKVSGSLSKQGKAWAWLALGAQEMQPGSHPASAYSVWRETAALWDCRMRNSLCLKSP